MFDPISVVPHAECLELLLTAVSPVSHHDPDNRGEGNMTLFRRQKHLLSARSSGVMPDQMQLDAFCLQQQAPPEVADLLQLISFPEFVGAAVVRTFLDLYNAGDGTGIFSGQERYARLEERLRYAAVRARNLRELWNLLLRDLQCPLPAVGSYEDVNRLLAQPPGLQGLTLASLARDYASTIMLAHSWHNAGKRQNEKYARSAGVMAGAPSVPLSWQEADLAANEDALVVELPALSGNSVRHQVVRDPGMRHLLRTLAAAESAVPEGAELTANWPGRGALPPGVEMLLVNGGNIAAGAKQASNPYALAWRMRETYPLLDLLGGVADSFDLQESRLKVGCWLVCAENAEALVHTAAEGLPASTVSAFRLLDEVTETRQAMHGQYSREVPESPKKAGQMLRSFETLCAGTQFLVKLCVSPDTPDLTGGCLLAAVEEFLGGIAAVGGQDARGYGNVRGELKLENRPLWEARKIAYEVYLAQNADQLADGLRTGRLGTGSVVLS